MKWFWNKKVKKQILYKNMSVNLIWTKHLLEDLEIIFKIENYENKKFNVFSVYNN